MTIRGFLTATALLIVLASTTACAGVRGATRDTFNSDMVSHKAPALIGTDWVMPAAEQDEDPPSLDGAWSLIVFVDPG